MSRSASRHPNPIGSRAVSWTAGATTAAGLRAAARRGRTGPAADCRRVSTEQREGQRGHDPHRPACGSACGTRTAGSRRIADHSRPHLTDEVARRRPSTGQARARRAARRAEQRQSVRGPVAGHRAVGRGEQVEQPARQVLAAATPAKNCWNAHSGVTSGAGRRRAAEHGDRGEAPAPPARAVGASQVSCPASAPWCAGQRAHQPVAISSAEAARAQSAAQPSVTAMRRSSVTRYAAGRSELQFHGGVPADERGGRDAGHERHRHLQGAEQEPAVVPLPGSRAACRTRRAAR